MLASVATERYLWPLSAPLTQTTHRQREEMSVESHSLIVGELAATAVLTVTTLEVHAENRLGVDT